MVVGVVVIPEAAAANQLARIAWRTRIPSIPTTWNPITVRATVPEASYVSATWKSAGTFPKPLIEAASVALAASIKGFGKVPADFQVAETYDASGTVALTVIGFQVVGIDGIRVRQAILASWLAAAASGMTTTPTTIAGKALIKVDYGDGGPLDYVYVHGQTVFDVSTADAALAATVLTQLP